MHLTTTHTCLTCQPFNWSLLSPPPLPSPPCPSSPTDSTTDRDVPPSPLLSPQLRHQDGKRQQVLKKQNTQANKLSFLFKKVVVCGHCVWFVDTVLWLCPSLPTETLKWLSSPPILMQESFWWWQCSGRYRISLFPHHHTPFPPSPLLPVPNKPYGFCGR